MFAMGMLAHKWGGRLATRVVHRVRSGWGRWAFVGFAWFWIMGIPATRHALPDAVLLASAMGLIPFMFAVTKSSKWDRFLGDLSYPLYCIHMLLFEVCRTILGRFHGHWNLFSPMVLVTSLAAAVLLYWYVDRIVEHLRIRVVARLGGL
jgi:peptidoglycan/LPS O-acetylase OafA/YrhL